MKENNHVVFRMEYVSMYCIAKMLLRNLWMILASAISLALIVSLLLSWTYVPQYSANMTYAVNSRADNSGSSASLTSTREVASVLSELLTTEMIYDGIRSSDPRLAGFDGTISAVQLGDTNFIQVTATASTPESAFLALNALVQVFPNAASFISSRSILTVMKNPSVTPAPTNPSNVEKMSLMGGAVGALAMAALLCYICIQRGTVQTRSGARNMLDAHIIASVPHEWKNRTVKTALRRVNKHVQVFSPTVSFGYTEQINAACSQLEHEASARGRKTFLITGIGENEGKSTVSGNIAAGLALKGHKVILLDCDLRKPAQKAFFDNEFKAELGLDQLLSCGNVAENIHRSITKSEKTGLYMMFCHQSDDRSAELLSSETMVSLLHLLRQDYDFVILDTPPMGMFPDTEILADLVDASMLVVRQDYVPACDINDHIDILRAYKAGFLGVVLNDMMQTPAHYSGHSRYGYGDHYGYGHSSRSGHDGASDGKEA